MTCIVGLVSKKTNKVIIGGDSSACSDENIFIRKDAKVFKNGRFIIGCTSSFRMMQLLRYSLYLPKISDKEIFEYMCTDFVNSVRHCFKDGGYLQKYTDGDEKGGTFLVAYRNRLFKIENDFQVAETENGIDSCGRGMDFALGSLYSTDGMEISDEDRITKALSAAEFLSPWVCRPFMLLKT